MEKLIEQFNLPTYIKGKSFAEASKAIQKKFEDREDEASNRTMEELLGRLQQAQEFVKEQDKSPEEKQQEQMQAQQGQEPNMQQGQMSQMQQGQGQPGQEQMAMGGFADSEFGARFQENTTGEEQAGSITSAIGMATTAIDFGHQAFGKTNVDMSGNGGEEKISGGGAALSGVAKGAAAGQALGPWGAGAGALIGGVSGLIGAGKHNKALDQAQTNKTHREYNQYMNEYGKGGFTNQYSGLNQFNSFINPPNKKLRVDNFETDLPTVKTPNFNGDINASVFGADIYKGVVPKIEDKKDYASLFTPGSGGMNSSKEVAQNAMKNNNSNDGNKALDWLGKNAGNIARYAPVGMNAYQLSKLKKPEVERLNKLDNRYKNQYVDERSLQNSVNEGFNQSSATEGSGGSLSRYSTISRANQLNKATALSNAYMKASDINRNENRTGQQFNRSTDQFNISQDNAERDINARNRAAYDNNKSKLLSQIGNDIREIGKEEVFKKQAKEIYGYTWNGKYYVNKDGQKVSKEDMTKKMSTNENMFGGFLKKTKK